ncbi:MAG: response regulator transcription factor [Chitinophagaceae bacterium]|nr:response regulator transcription factor [Chitinophagaceae bacterium]
MSKTSQVVHVALADDHKIFRDGIKMALGYKKDLKIVWEADNGKELLHKITIKKPDVLLMDIRMPEIDGINAIELLRKEHSDVKIIVLSMYDDQQTITKMMSNGANAYLSKTTDPDEIYDAILTCMSDDFYFNQLVNQAVIGGLINKRGTKRNFPNKVPVTFNEKELRILQLIGDDMNTEEISKEIFLSPRTIESIRQKMKDKVGAKTIGGLIMYGVRNKMIE